VNVAFLYLNLDRFKLVNDSIGHEAGDEVLRQVAQRLRESLRFEATAARLVAMSSLCCWRT
jgi:diguanylate cyclase (GGDEF)-like protein